MENDASLALYKPLVQNTTSMEESSLNLPTGMRTAEMYPFGREEEDSFERLFMFFREHLRQGHWALAQACMPQLRQWKGGGAEEVKEIIQAIVACPYKLLWESVSSPHRLAWLWLLELELWWSHDQISLPPHVRSEIEFFLLLELLQPQVSQDVIKELHDIFLNCHNPDLVTDLKKMDYSTHKLSSEAFSSLFNLLSRSPQLVQAVISFLLVENSNSSAVEYNHTLQKLFVDFLHYALCSLKKARQGEAKNGSDMEMHERTTNQIYSIISVLTFDVERRTFEIRQLCEELYNACCATEYGLNEDRLLGCMLGKQNQSLISLYSAVSIEKSKEKLVAHISPERVSFELSEAERVTLALFTDSEEHSVWKELYFYSTSNSKHFLEQILVTALQCIKREDYSTLSRVLKKTFKPFTRLLVLLGWTYCQSLESAQTLLYTLHENKDLCCDAVLHNFCTGLSSHIEVLEWCLKQNRNSIPEKNFIRHLYSLDCHSALYSLHHFTNLPALKAEDIIDLLQKQSANDKGARCLSMMQRRNVTLYQALCAIKYAIYALCINAHQPSSCKDCPYLALDAAVTDIAAENDQSRSQDCSAVFKLYLSRCQEFLHVIPAPFRLEVLENIFSLLFLSYNDLNGDKAGLEGQFCLEEEGDTEQIQALKGFGCTVGHLESTVGSVDYNVPHREHTNTGLEENATLKSSGVLHDDCTHKLKKIDFMSKFAENDSTTKELDYLDLKHFMMSASRGNDFLVNPVTMNIFLELIKGHLEAMKCHVPWTSGNVSEEDVQLVECLNCSIGADSFGSRLAQLSRYICEAQWRYKVVTSNNTAEGDLLSFTRKPPSLSKHSTLKRRNKAQRNRNEQSSSSQLTVESVSGDLSTSTSDGGVVNLTATNEQGLKAQVPRRNLLLPMMLAPPESLLISCILRGNFAQAHQVALMFEMQSSYCYSELIFMERYQEVINELVKVEQKMENQGMDNANRKLSVGRFTLQAIGDAAAAGMVFYSISDVIEKLINSPEVTNSALSESFWKSNVQIEPTNPLHDILEYLSAPAMAVFDLACTQCQLWKTCKQLLETAERRLMAVFEAKGRKPDSAAHQPDGIQGFPSVLQQMSKILNFSHSSHGSTKIKPSEDRVTRHLSCSLTDLLLACYPELSEDCVTTQLNLSESLEQITQKLQTAIKSTEAKTNILSWLEQTSSRSQDSEGHTIRSQMKQLLKNLDRQIEAVMDNQIRPDYVRSLFDYINTLAAVLVRSMNRDTDQFADIKVGNPFIVLQQTPSQLFAQLLFEKPTSPDRLFMLLHKEELNLNVQEIIVSCCCERLPLWNTRKLSHRPFFLNEVTKLIEENTKGCLPDLGFTLPSSLHLAEEIVESELSESSLGPYSLIPSALNFLKSRSKLLAVLVCLTATRGHRALKHSLSWKERLSSRTEAPLDMEQICKECEELMKEFPILEHFLSVMAEPFPRTQEETASLVDSLYGNPCTTLLLSGLHSEMAVNTVIEVLRQFLSDRHWLRALKILELYGDESEEFEKLKDVLLGCAVMEEKEGWEYLIRIRNATLRAKLVLHCVEKWPLDVCLEVLFYCLSDPNTNKRELKSDLLAKKKELQVYQKILNLEPPIPWHGWQELRTESNENPQTVMDVILKSREFELCESWVRLHPVPMNFTVKLRHEYLLHLLELGEGEKAFQLLQGICDPDMCQVICEQALDQHPGLAACHFLSNYLTTHFHKSLSAARCHEIQAMRIGSKLLLTLPESAHDAYSHLSSNPLLMLEQLLMNMKVDWASVAVQTLHQLLMGQEAGFAIEDIDCLLSKYAAKALEVPYAVREKTRSDSVINLQDLLTQSAGPESIAILPNIEQTTSLPSVNPPLHGPSTAQGSIRRSKSITEFVPPDSPPAKKDWVPDSKAMFCLVCYKERFTMFNRRHHCRRCGRVVCQSCSTNKMVVKDCRENPVRVCDQCYNYYHTKGKEHLDEGEDATSCAEAGTEFAAALQMPRVAETHWNLTLNEDENENERSEFSYEQAPSASLCIAILNLHSNSMVCGHQLIDHCSKLSQALTNPEVDACLLMDIMKQLLFSAKMMFVKAGRSQDLALCDSYISKVDVVKILVAANYQDVPSLEQILKPAAITRLRNKLLETEYYALAVEVSTKSGLDPGGVWQAWGLACLKVGNLSGAREKFSRCLKPPFDRNQLNPGSSLLQEIVQHLETSVKPVFSTQGDDILVSLRELEAMLKVDGVASEIKGDGKIKQQVFYEECLFYLQSYGTNLALISFYMRHNCTREALQHLLNKDCPEEVFIQGIFIPSYVTGRLHALENLMEELDPSLERWSHHLIASCKHLQMRGFFNILYDLQCFMKDHMRAAMTCIRFFSHKAESYSALGAEQGWLVEAKGHLKTYLQEVSNRSSSRKKNTSSFRKKMSAADVSRYINTIELQIEVTKFLHRCEISGNSRISGPPANLFGNNKMKMEVACKVLLGGKNIEEGFGISFRVIQDFQLDAAAVYDKAAKHLLQQHKVSQIRQLLKCVSESGVASGDDTDNLLIRFIEGGDEQLSQSKELEKLILEMKKDDNKIKAFLLSNKYRSAYLVAVKLDTVQAVHSVQEVLEAAERAQEELIPKICRDWLKSHQPKMLTQKTHGN